MGGWVQTRSAFESHHDISGHEIWTSRRRPGRLCMWPATTDTLTRATHDGRGPRTAMRPAGSAPEQLHAAIGVRAVEMRGSSRTAYDSQTWPRTLAPCLGLCTSSTFHGNLPGTPIMERWRKCHAARSMRWSYNLRRT